MGEPAQQALHPADGVGVDVRDAIQGIARQPEAQSRLYGTMFLIIGLCESAYFINLAFMALFVFALS